MTLVYQDPAAAILTVFSASPDGGRGLARDMAVRWAMEELGLAYQVRTVALPDLQRPGHTAIHPFGQIPVFQDSDVTLFESAAIVLYLAEGRPGLLPSGKIQRARAITWVFASANTVEPPIIQLETARRAYASEPWARQALAPLEDAVTRKLSALDRHLERRTWLEGTFSAGDVLMVQTLRRLPGAELLRPHANLVAYVERGEGRPAFQRAFASQRETWRETTGLEPGPSPTASR